MENFIEYLTANEHIAYPFGEDAAALVPEWDDVAVTGDATMPKDFLADAVIVVPAEHAGYLYLQDIHCTSLTEYVLNIYDEFGVNVIALAIDIGPPVPPEHSVIQEISAGPTVYAVRMLTGPSFIDYLNKIGTDLGLGNAAQFGVRLPFETAAIEFRPRRVEKIIFKDSLSGLDYELTEDVNLHEGYNIALVEALGEISVEADPGLGQGKNDEVCGGVQQPSWQDKLTSLSGSRTDEDGNISLRGDRCHRIQADPVNYRLLIYNDCQAGCTAEDYAYTAYALENMFERARRLWMGAFDEDPAYANLLKVIETLNEHITEYNDDIFPKLRTVGCWGHIIVGSSLEGGGALGSRAYATVALVFVNRTSEPVTLTGSLAFSKPVSKVTAKYEGKNPVTINIGSINGTLAPFVEAHSYLLVQSNMSGDSRPALDGMTATVNVSWTQYGNNKNLIQVIS